MDDLQIILGLVIMAIMVAALWKVFSKADEPGWACVVPFYNLYTLVKISGKPLWWMILYFVPLANIVASVIVSVGVAERFGKDSLYGLGLCFLGPIFFPLLAFGDAQYEGGHYAKAA